MNTNWSWLVAISVAVGFVGGVLGWLQLVQSHAAAQDARANLHRMEELRERVIQLRTLDSQALAIGEQPIESTGAWVNYGRSANIPETKFAEINRLPMSKIEKTPYSRDDVFLRLTDVTAEQVVKFATTCSDASIGYSVVSVHFIPAGAQNSDSEAWNVSLVLTRILYTATNDT